MVDAVDQPGSRVSLDGVQRRCGSASNLFVDRLRKAAVQLTDFGHAYSPEGVSVKVLAAG